MANPKLSSATSKLLLSNCGENSINELEQIYSRRIALGLWRLIGRGRNCINSWVKESKSGCVFHPTKKTKHEALVSKENIESSKFPATCLKAPEKINAMEIKNVKSKSVFNKNNASRSPCDENLMSYDPSGLNTTLKMNKRSSQHKCLSQLSPVIQNANEFNKSHSVICSSPSSSEDLTKIPGRKDSREKQFSLKSIYRFSSSLYLVIFIVLLVSGLSNACGPGRGAGRRRAPRKLTPLVYKQHVPNVAEHTLTSSGLNEGKITRGHKRFKALVPNYNRDILFRDDEGTGADRLMTQRCKEKLNTLAISVMNQWPGVRLRVIEGWDEENLHAPNSLHYEGRAVDITTSDKDRSKYGMLARLAVEAGFDWVYYESRAHIHCSVKSDSSQGPRTGGCFSKDSTVQTPTGQFKMSELKKGDKVLSLDSNGSPVYSEVLLFLDKHEAEMREFFKLKSETGRVLTLTPSHLIYVITPSNAPEELEGINPKDITVEDFYKYAEVRFVKYVQNDDWILYKNGDDFKIEKIVHMEAEIQQGVYAPLTMTGNVIVDGALASCYAVIEDQWMAHLAFAPIRLAHNMMNGMSHVWKSFSNFMTLRPHQKSEGDATKKSNKSTNEAKPLASAEANDNSNNYDDNGNENEKNYRSGNEHIDTKSHDESSMTQQNEQGIHWYASLLYNLSSILLPKHLLYEF